jgi:restriction system protein
VGAEAILEYLPIDGTIRIPDVLLDYESEGIIFQRAIKYHRENDIPGLNSGYALRFLELTSGVTYSTPGQVCDLFHNLASDRLRFTLDKDWSTRLRSIAPSVIRLSDNLLNLISRDPSAIWNLSPAEFEKLIGELFERDGYSVSFTKKSRDGGIDLFASKRDVAGEHLTIVQCKRYAAHNPVRVGIVREVIGSMNVKNATAAAIFTTSRFTRDAVEESRKIKYRLSLHDYFDIMKNISSSPGDC